MGHPWPNNPAGSLMFETDPNLWLQTLSAPWLLALMLGVSALGTATFYTFAFVLLAFGVRLRPMLCVLLALILASTATSAIKLGFGLPRPSEVDARVLDEGELGNALAERGGASSFWSLPDGSAIEAVRDTGRHDYGFVSGHASAATAFVLGLALFSGTRRRWLWAAAIGWALLMGISRMYLGRHFLGDVLGGWLLGAVSVALAWWFVRALDTLDETSRRRLVLGAAATIGILFLLALRLPFLAPGSLGELAGTLACLVLVSRTDIRDDAGIPRRMLRAVLALGFIFGVNMLLEAIQTSAGWPGQHPAGFALAAIGFPLAILGAVLLARWLGLYRTAAAAG